MQVTGPRIHIRCCAEHRGALLGEGSMGCSVSPGSEVNAKPTHNKLLWRKLMMRMPFVSEASLLMITQLILMVVPTKCLIK